MPAHPQAGLAWDDSSANFLGDERNARMRRGFDGFESGLHIAFAKSARIHFVEGVDALAQFCAAYGSFL